MVQAVIYFTDTLSESFQGRLHLLLSKRSHKMFNFLACLDLYVQYTFLIVSKPITGHG